MATKNDVKPQTLWTSTNDGRIVTVTDVEGDIVEYGYINVDQVFYLTIPNFLNNFRKKDDTDGLNKEELMEELRKSLVSLKEAGQGDRVYAMLDSMGL